jgi:D-alanyl-D-alanine carboxypeptidase/D-alanyl-D-alanine-endopeptidase (penicillin-binding protein 4)
MLFGLSADGTTTMAGALAAEQAVLSSTFGISPDQYHFVDGSGGTDTTATSGAVISLLKGMSRQSVFSSYLDSLPTLGVDGSLATITNFEADPALAGAKGRVHAKTGTYVAPDSSAASGAILKGQSLAGYIDTKAGHRLAFIVTVNNVPMSTLDDVIAVFQDEGTISALLWSLQ